MLKYRIIAHLLAIFLLTGSVYAGQPIDRSNPSLQKTSINDVFAPMDINNIFSYYKNNGDGSLNPYTGDGGFELISARRGITVFEEGVAFGGYHNGILKVGGSTYSQGWQAGPILTPAVVVGGVLYSAPVAADPNDPKYRLYRVRPDVTAATPFVMVKQLLDQEIALYAKYDSTVTPQSLYDSYLRDWNEWPADEGAPFKDVNGNGTYDPTIDIPGVPGADQTMWYVVNDLDVSRAHHLYGSDPIGIEMQKTIWAYRRSDALGNTIFQKNKFINKSGFAVDSMYVGQWADCDVGGGPGYKDDFVGCDPVLGLGFTYNGTNNDGFFQAMPPAVGFDFIQGPIVRTGKQADRAIFDGAYRYGFKNLPMTSFVFFINSNNLYRDAALDNPKGTPEFYNLLKGNTVSTGAPNIDPTTGEQTKYMFAGDPVTGKGWIDGSIAGPGDRRMLQSSGPFTFAAGDTQEVVVAELAAQSYDRLSSVSLLKYFDRKVQSAYDQFFDLPKPPAQPVVSTFGFDQKVVIDWGSDASVQAVETPAPKGYAFQGYNVYQLPGPSFENPKLLATYDLPDQYGTIVDTVFSTPLNALVYIPVQNGNNQGVARHFTATSDYIKNTSLVNGQTYYFAVTAYNLNPAPGASPVSLESMPAVFSVVPNATVPGVQLGSNALDTIAVTHVSGGGDVVVTPIVMDPTKLTGNTYTVTFDTLNGQSVWTLTNTTTGLPLLSKQTNLSGDEAYKSVDGFLLKVTGPLKPGMKQWWIPNGVRVFSPVGGFTNLGLEGFSDASNPTAYNQAAGTIGMAGHFAFGSIGTTLTESGYKNVLLKFAATDTGTNLWNPLEVPADPNFSKGYRYLRGAAAAPADPSFAPWIKNQAAGYPYQDFNYSVPFSAWDMETDPPTRLAVGMLENNVVGASVDGRYWPPVSNMGNNSVNREFAFIFNKPYSETVDPTLAVDMYSNASTPLMWVITCARRNGNPWAAGNEFLITATHPSSKADVFSFTPAAPVTAVDSHSGEVITTYDLKQNYPNPFNPSTTISYQLPAASRVTLKIYDLLGREVATLVDGVKPAGKFTAVWNAQKQTSGVYFYRIQAGTYTMTRKLMLLR